MDEEPISYQSSFVIACAIMAVATFLVLVLRTLCKLRQEIGLE